MILFHLKKILFFLDSIFYKFIYLITKKNKINKIENIYILLRKPLGIGDLCMLSPLISLVDKHIKNNSLNIISEYDNFFQLPNLIFMKPNKKIKFKINDLIISPTFSILNIKYFFNSSYKIGYFFSNRFFYNFIEKKISRNQRYNTDNHYLSRIKPILKHINIPFKHDFEYPQLIFSKFKLPFTNYICISPFSNWNERQYSLDSYKYIIKSLLKKKINIVILGTDSKNFNFNINDPKFLDLVGKTSLSEASYIIKNSQLFVSNDSGLSHFAYLSRNKTISIFGCVKPEQRLPKNKKLISSIASFSNYKSCKNFSCYDGFTKPTCINNEKYSCLDINPRAILDEILKEI